MSAKYSPAWVVVLGASAVGVSVSGRGYLSARSSATLELERAGGIVRQVAELEAARPVAAQWRERRRPTSGLAANLGQTLSACGIAPGALVNVSPQPESPVESAANANADLRRQRAALTLYPVTLPQLGAFLESWRAREPYWTVTTIDLSPDAAAKLPGGGDIPLRAVMNMEAVYLADAGEERK
jgi:hypothetical protein